MHAILMFRYLGPCQSHPHRNHGENQSKQSIYIICKIVPSCFKTLPMILRFCHSPMCVAVLAYEMIILLKSTKLICSLQFVTENILLLFCLEFWFASFSVFPS